MASRRQLAQLSLQESLSEFIGFEYRPKRENGQKQMFTVRSVRITQQSSQGNPSSPNGPVGVVLGVNSTYEIQSDDDYQVGQGRAFASVRRKTKIVCTIGPSTSSREMIWKLAETGMNVVRLKMSHGDHTSHQKTSDLVKEYNSQFKDKVIAIILDTKGPEVRSGDVPQPILLTEGQELNFTIRRGVSTKDTFGQIPKKLKDNKATEHLHLFLLNFQSSKNDAVPISNAAR